MPHQKDLPSHQVGFIFRRNTVPERSEGFTPILVVTILAIVLSIISYYIYRNYPYGAPIPPQQLACTLEAKICPDGTSVGRSGPRCEFSPCPTPQESTPSADMTNWKTYTNTRYGIQFSAPQSQEGGYHSDLYNSMRSPVNPGGPEKCLAYGLYESTFDVNHSMPSSFYITASFWLPLHKVIDSNAWYDSCLKQLYSTPQAETHLINGKKVLMMKIRGSQNNFDRYIFVNNSLVYDFGFPYPLTQSQDQQVQQILESLKFSKPTIQ